VRESAAAILDDVRRAVAESWPELEVRVHVVEQDAREALVQCSESAHLVVVGSRGRGPLTRVVLGSVSTAVTRTAACPVVVCRPTPPTARRSGIVVGADGTAESRPVLEFAFEQAAALGLPLVVMHCFFDATLVLGDYDGPRPAEPSDAEDLRVMLAESVAGLRDSYPDVELRLELATGLVDQCLLEQAPKADLLVVGRSNPAGWSRFLQASCSLAVLERADCAVAVVPELLESRVESR
jgi:nucleotide-binding universal stress UspA family protein